ncbi:MAG TPA: MFS transporter [Candidatus Limnocylindria bacterium]|nr:MFS transporter [Candidatus Limnocylindria bacterium]
MRIVAISQVVTLIGFNFSYPFLPLFIQELGVTDRSELALWTGLVIGGSGIAMALASPVWGLLADRFGPKAMYVRSLGAGTLVLGLQSFVLTVPQLVAVRLANGALTGSQTAGAMLLASIVPRDRTGASLGLLSAAAQVGNLVGPVLGGVVVAAIGLRSSFLVGAALLAACAIGAALYVREGGDHALPTAPRLRAREVLVPFGWPSLRGVLIVGAAVHLLNAGSAGVIAIYVQDLARPSWLTLEMAVGLVFALGAAAAAATMPLLGGRADRGDPRRQLAASLALFAVSLLPQVVLPNALAFLLARVATGVALAGVITSMAVLTRSAAPAGAEGRAFGALATVQNLGWGTGPIVGSAFAAVAGIPALYLWTALLMIVFAGLVGASPRLFGRPETFVPASRHVR